MTKQVLAIRRQGQGQPVRRELRNVFLQSCLLKWTQQKVPANHTLLHREYELLQAECGARATPDVYHRSLPLRATIRNLIGIQRSDRVREGRYDLVLHIERFVKWSAKDAHRFR
jgi:hypothetical protein